MMMMMIMIVVMMIVVMMMDVIVLTDDHDDNLDNYCQFTLTINPLPFQFSTIIYKFQPHFMVYVHVAID